MKVTASMLREIAAMPAEAMAASLRFLAVQLETEERKRGLAAERQRKYDAKTRVRSSSDERHSDAEMTPLARVIDNTSFLQTVDKKEEEPPVVPQPPKPALNVSRLTDVEYPEGFEEFWEAYPPRAGGRDKIAAVRAYRAALKRASSGRIITGARAYRDYVSAAGKLKTEFVKQARTWLNGNGWEEDYEHAEQSRAQPRRVSNLEIILGARPEGFD